VFVLGGAVMVWVVIDAGKNYQRLEGGGDPHTRSNLKYTVPRVSFFFKWPRLSKHDGGGSQLIILWRLCS